MLNFKITSLIIFLVILFFSIILFQHEIYFNVEKISSYNDSPLPVLELDTISVNLFYLFVLVISFLLVTIYSISNVIFAIYLLFLVSPLVRQVDYINIYFGKILPLLIILGFLIKENFIIPKLKFNKDVRFYIFLLITGLILSSFFNGLSFIPVVRQIIFFIVIYIIFYYYRKGNLNKIPLLIVFGALIISFDIIIQSILAENNILRFSQAGLIFDNQTAAGTVIMCAVPFYFIIKKLNYISNINSIFFKLIIPIFLLATIFTGSRGSLLGIGFFLIFFYFSEKSRFLTLSIICFFIGFFFLIIQIPFFYEILRVDNPLSKRDILFSLGFQTILDNLLFGIGPGKFSEVAFVFGSQNNLLEEVKGGIFGSSSHNVYIDAYLDAGIIGFLALLFLYYNILKSSYGNPYFHRIRSSFLMSYIIISFFGSKVILGGAITEGLIIWTILILPSLFMHNCHSQNNEK